MSFALFAGLTASAAALAGLGDRWAATDARRAADRAWQLPLSGHPRVPPASDHGPAEGTPPRSAAVTP